MTSVLNLLVRLLGNFFFAPCLKIVDGVGGTSCTILRVLPVIIIRLALFVLR